MALCDLLTKGLRELFCSRSTQALPGDLQNTSNESLGPPATASQKKFKKSNDAQRDISVLAMTYILQENSNIRDIICLILGLHAHYGDRLSETVDLSARFTLQLASLHERDSSEALAAITVFLGIMIDTYTLVENEAETTNNIYSTMDISIRQIKIMIPLLDNRNTNGDEGLSEIMLDTISRTTITILDVFNDASNAIPVPFVRPLLLSVARLLKASEQTRSNVDDMRQVVIVVRDFVIGLAVVCAEDKREPSFLFKGTLEMFQNELEGITQRCNEASHCHVLSQFLQHGVDENRLSAIEGKVEDVLKQFKIDLGLHLRLEFEVMHEERDVEVVNALPKFTSYFVRPNDYFPQSRTDDIQAFAEWLENSKQLVFWIHSGPGFGKSTLAYKMVDSLIAEGRLATFAFLVHGSSSDPIIDIQIMAKRLCALHPRVVPKVAAAARTCKSSLREYMESYIIEPILSLSYPYPLVIVVDALHEWEHYEVFLEQLEHFPQPSPVKFLLMSHTNDSIARLLLKVPTKKHHLQPVSQIITMKYFKYNFERMNWRPPEALILDLARFAEGLPLIWAATVFSLLSHNILSRRRMLDKNLEKILSSGKQIAPESQLQLANLYRDALEQLFRDNKAYNLFRQVFGAMIVLRQPLSLLDFACLLDIPDDEVSIVQDQIPAVQTRGTFDRDTVAPASEHFHTSFIGFTMNRELQEADNSYLNAIDPQMAHESMAKGCLSFLNRFFSSSGCISKLGLYAVEFWPLHLASSNDRFMPLSSSFEKVLLTKNHLRQWGARFLAISLPGSSQNWDEVLAYVDEGGFYCSLAEVLENNMSMDTTLAPRITFCLEVAVRLQPELQKAWEDLGNSYRKRFDSNGTLYLLNSAIIVYRHASKLKDGSPLTSMSSLADALRCRFGKTGSMADLEETISTFRELLSLYPAPHPSRPSTLKNLISVLETRFNERGFQSDFDEVTLLRQDPLAISQ